jgi:hypothetical protein
MNLLIIGNTTSSGWNLKKGLEKYYSDSFKRIDLVFDPNPTISGHQSEYLLEPGEYDFVLYNYPFIKTYLKHKKYLNSGAKIINWWRGTDLRGKDFKNPLMNIGYKIMHYFFIRKMFKKAKINLYSTFDLSWFIKAKNKQHFYQIIDTDKFINTNNPHRNGTIVLSKGAKGYNKQRINHKNMPEVLNRYEYARIYPAEGLDSHTIQVSHLECLACGLIVYHHEEKNRDWVIKNCSIKAGADRFIKIIKRVENE